MTREDERWPVRFLKDGHGYMILIEHDRVRMQIDLGAGATEALMMNLDDPPSDPFDGFEITASRVRSSYQSRWLPHTALVVLMCFVVFVIWYAGAP